MKLLVVNNLASGYRDGAIYDFVRSVAQDNDEIIIRSTDGTTDLRSFLHDADQFDLVVASGGDGTITGVCYELANTGIPILPFPAGTGNLLTLNILHPTEPHALAKLARSGCTMDFDMGELTVNGKPYGFGIMAGAGWDAAIMRGAVPSKKILGPMAYLKSALENTMPKKAHFTIELDGETIESDGIGVLVVNFSKIQFDLSVTHENAPADGMFDIVILKAKDAFGLIPFMGSVMLDRSGEFPDRSNAVEIHRAKHAIIHSDPPLEIQFDGEVTDATTPFEARILEKATTLVVSDEAINYFAE